MVRNIVLTGLAIALLTGCSSKKEENQNTETEAIPVKVMKLEKRNIAKTLDYTATLQADEQVYYAPVSAGRIGKIYVEVGDRIKKGQLLVEMDPTNYQQAKVQLKNLETEYNRAVKLNETGSISKQAYDAAVTNYEVAKSNYDFLKENTKMLAPFDGIVTGKYFENGELYTGIATGGAAKPSIIAIEKINPLKAYVNLSEQYFLAVKKGTKVEFKCNIYPERIFEGTVNIVYPTIDPASRTFTVEVKIPNNDEAFRHIFLNVRSIRPRISRHDRYIRRVHFRILVHRQLYIGENSQYQDGQEDHQGGNRLVYRCIIYTHSSNYVLN